MRGTFLRVGLLLLAGVVLVVGAALFLGGNQIRHGRAYETYFRDSVQGLDTGAAVKYRGVTVGAVTSIGLVAAEYGAGQPAAVQSTDYRAVVVRYEIDVARIGEVLNGDAIAREGVRARIAPQGLTGLSYVELDFVNPARFPAMTVSWTPRTDYIPSVPSTLSQVQDAATVLLGKIQLVDINGLADGVLGLVTELRGSLKDGDLHRTLSEASQTLAATRAALEAADIPGLSAEARRTLAAARGTVAGPQVQALLRSANAAAERLAQGTARLPQLIAGLEAVARRADSLSSDAEAGLAPILRDARTTVATLRQVSESLRRDPGQVVLGGPPPRTTDDGKRAR